MDSRAWNHPVGQRLWDELLDYAATVGGSRHTFLFLVDPARRRRRGCAAQGMFEFLKGRQIARGEGLIGRVWDHKLPQFLGGHELWEGVLPADAPLGLGALAVLPLVDGERFRGVMGLAHEQPGRGFVNEQAPLLQALARLAVAILRESESAAEGRSRRAVSALDPPSLADGDAALQGSFLSLSLGDPLAAGEAEPDPAHRSHDDRQLLKAPAELGSGLASWEWDVDTDRVGWSEELALLMSLAPRPERARREDFLAAIHPDDRFDVAEALEAVASAGSDFHVRFRVNWPDGSTRWLESRATLFIQDRNHGPLLMGWVGDITHFKRLEDGYHRLERQHRLVLDSFPASVLIKDAEGRILEANRAASQLLGASPDELRGRFADQFVVDPVVSAEEHEADLEVIRTGSPRLGVMGPAITRGGQPSWVRTDRVPLLSPEGEVTGVIVYRSEVGWQGMPVDEEIEAELIDEESSLLFGESEADLNPVLDPLNVSRFLDQVEPLLQSVLSPSCELDLRSGADLLPVTADARLLRRALMSLVRNACDALGQEGGVVSVSGGAISCSGEYLSGLRSTEDLESGEYIYLEVSEPGCGMEEDIVDKVFDPLFSTKIAGQGMGLTLVERIVGWHHGGIRVESEPGAGTTIKILLPAGVAAGSAGHPARWSSTPARGMARRSQRKSTRPGQDH